LLTIQTSARDSLCTFAVCCINCLEAIKRHLQHMHLWQMQIWL